MTDMQEKFKFSYTIVTIKLGTSQAYEGDVQLFLACTVVNSFFGRTLSNIAQSLVTCLSDECDTVLLLAGFPIQTH